MFWESPDAAVTMLLAGKPVGEVRGGDAGTDGLARIDRSGMLRLVARASREHHVLTLVASDPGLRAFVFIFGPWAAFMSRVCSVLQHDVPSLDCP